ncbi:hypothetical protein [Leclercia adecarboxylata]|uniref:hypothetical protein n=1 Tax=Leclercia adecarboxylata TaxID=83655 RepID=UPI00384C11FD
MLIIILLTSGFFFPLAWAVLVAYLIYLFLSKEKRRNSAIENRIKKMILSGVNYCGFKEIYYEAAKSYAISKGSRAADNESAGATIEINGKNYFAVFIRRNDGGVDISLQYEEQVTKFVDELFKGVEDSAKARPNPKPIVQSRPETPQKLVVPSRHITAKEFTHEHVSLINSIDNYEFKQPTWFNDKGFIKEFANIVIGKTNTMGIPHSYAIVYIIQDETGSILGDFILAAERESKDFEFQKEVAAEVIKFSWNRLGEDTKEEAYLISQKYSVEDIMLSENL